MSTDTTAPPLEVIALLWHILNDPRGGAYPATDPDAEQVAAGKRQTKILNRQVIALYLPHEHQPKRNAVTRIGRLRKVGRVEARLDDGVSYSYAGGTFTVRRETS